MILPKVKEFFKRLGIQIPIIIAVHFTLIVGVLLYGLLQGYKISAKRTEEYSKLLSVAIINQHQGIVTEAGLILENWAKSLEENSALAGSAACGAPIISLLADNQERYLVYGAIDRSYEIVCAQDPFEKGTNVKHRKYIRDAFQHQKLTVSGYQIGVVTGKPSINFGYPVINKSGEVTHVLVLALSLDWTNEALSYMSLPEFSEVMIVDNTGLIINSYSENGDRFGEAAFNRVTFQRILEGKEVTFEAKGIDAIRKSYTVEPIYITGEDSPDAFVVAGIPKEALLEDVDNLRDKIVTLIFYTFIIEFIIVVLFSTKTPEEKTLVK